MNNSIDTTERRKIRDCIFTIRDCLNAIESETYREMPFKPYMLDKMTPILNDVNVLKNILDK